jgi:shikimate dehydrogenase
MQREKNNLSMHLGLIGKSLSHSFSKPYFEEKFLQLNLTQCAYSNFELENISDFTKLLTENSLLNGLNITNPYKEAVIPFLNDLSDEAKEIQAVNCIKINAGKLVGYNTDYYGFSQSIKPFLEPKHNKALILGTGGASKAVAYALKKIGVEVYFVTSSQIKKSINTFFYTELNNHIFNAFGLIVNTTPLGLYPNINEAPNIPYELITPNHLCYDLIYNPTETLFLKQAKQQGALIVNGLSMLKLQAEKAWEIWSN